MLVLKLGHGTAHFWSSRKALKKAASPAWSARRQNVGNILVRAHDDDAAARDQ
jgi:hypothetical protein